MKKGLILIITLLLIINISFLSAWWDDDWGKCKDMNVTGGNSILTNFPFYANISHDSDMQEDRDDVRIVNASCGNGGSEISYEIDSNTSNSFGIWANATLNTGINEFSMYYDNSEASAGSTKDIWESSFSERFVLHLNKNITKILNVWNPSNNWTMTGNVKLNKSCAFGNCLNSYEKNVLNNYINHAETIASSETVIGSYSFWTKFPNGESGRIGGRGTQGVTTEWMMTINSAGTLAGLYVASSCYSAATGSSTGGVNGNNSGMNDNKWHLVYMQWNATGTYFSVDGGDVKWCNGKLPVSGGTGGDFMIRTYHTTSAYSNGTFDEMRYDDIFKNLDYQIRDYQNVNFSTVTFGAEETKPAVDTCTYSGSGNWAVNCSDNCTISSNVVGDLSNLTIIGTGKFILNANISDFVRYYFRGACRVTCKDGCFKE